MRKIKLTYDHKTFAGDWIRREYTTDNGKDYERVVNIIHNNSDDYKIVKVEHVEV